MIQAATLLLLRDTDHGPEVFMLQRHHKIAFAGGALVFPGGKVDPQDADMRALCDGVDGIDGIDDDECSIRVAALRETFEESGYLLARRRGEDSLLDHEALASLQRERRLLHQNELTLRAIAEAEGLRFACDRLVPFARWITPEHLPRQYDTHFFLAQAPRLQEGAHDGIESIDSCWGTPEDFLQRSQTGDATIIFPTRMNLHRLLAAHDVAEALAQAAAQPVVTVRPWVEDRPDGPVICIPSGAGYDQTEDTLARVLREEGIEFREEEG